MTPQDILTIAAGLGLAEAVRGYFPLARSLRQAERTRSTERAELPPVSVIRPIKDKDFGLEENLEAALSFDYPDDIQTVFVLDDREDPAYALVRDAAANARRSGQDVSVVLCGSPPPGMTGKLHAMSIGLEHARHDVVAFADSDTRAGPHLLRRLVTPLVEDDRVGSTFAPVVVDQALKTPGDAGYALMLNGLYSPAARHAAGPEGRLPFIMGQFMAFRRDTLDAIGGLEGTAGELVDDMSIGLRMDAAGLSNVMVTEPMSIVQANLSLKGFDSVYRRWITFSRRGLPLRFKLPLQLRATLWWVLLLLSVGSALAGAPIAAGLAAAGVLVTGVSVNILHRQVGGAPLGLRLGWVIFALLLVSPYIYAKVLFGRQVSWRGRTYQLDKNAKLAARFDKKKRKAAAPLPSQELHV